METFVVTGGAGFIGSAFIRYMLKKHRDRRIVCFDALTYAADMSNLSSVMRDPFFSFIKGDITAEDDVENLFASYRPSVIVNFAAESHVDRSIESPSLFIKTNVDGTGALLDASLRHGIRRFHQISTDEVYGSLSLENSQMFTEQSPLVPSGPYSASKAAADLLVLAYYRTYALPVTITRSSNNYGKYQFPEKLIPVIVSRALRGENIPVYGDGKNVRDWLNVEEHCRAVDLVFRRGRAGEVYNVGGNSEVSNIDLVKFILSKLGKSEDLIRFVADRKGHDRRYALNFSKLYEELGWEPKVSLSQGISETVNWYTKHEEWLKEVESGAYKNRNAAILARENCELL